MSGSATVPHVSSESRWRQPLRWGSANLHYLGLIALMAGVGALVAAAVAQGLCKPVHGYSSGGRYYFADHIKSTIDVLKGADWDKLHVASGIVAGLGASGLFVAGAVLIYKYEAKQRAERREAAITSQLQGASQPSPNRLTGYELLTRLLVVLAAFATAYGVTSEVVLRSGIAFDVQGVKGIEQLKTIHILNPSTLATIKAVSWPLLIAGAGATVVGFGGHTLLAKKLRSLRGLE